MMFLMLLVIAVSSMLAASLPDRSACGNRTGHGRDCAEFRAQRHVRQLRARFCSRSPAEGYFALLAHRLHFDHAGDAGGARAEKRDALIGELEQAKGDFPTKARPPRRNPPTSPKSRFLAQMSHELRHAR